MSAQNLNVLAFAATVLGSSLGIWGALMQANAYYPFRISEFAEHIARVFNKAIRTWSLEEALKQIRVTAKLGEEKKEDRAKSLIGLYLVFCGFFLNLIGASLALVASVIDAHSRK
ncbi:MAG TPA: hypothetical protein VGI34_09860 [Candidatus Acidoferrales bacterium]|jgi:hypothetical protein